MRYLWGSFVALWIAAQPVGFAADVKPLKVEHSPEQPRSGEPVRITALGNGIGGQQNLSLEYQIVDPGKYIELKEPAYTNGWLSVPMNHEVRGTGSVFTAVLPGALQMHRRLVRYRIVAGGRVIAPEATDPQRNFGYFVYDGVPPWRGAINPAANDASLRAAATFSAELMRSVQ